MRKNKQHRAEKSANSSNKVPTIKATSSQRKKEQKILSKADYFRPNDTASEISMLSEAILQSLKTQSPTPIFMNEMSPLLTLDESRIDVRLQAKHRPEHPTSLRLITITDCYSRQLLALQIIPVK